MSDREAFEKIYPVPEDSHFDTALNKYIPDELMTNPWAEIHQQNRNWSVWQAAIASMQGEAKFNATADADRLRSVARGMSYNDMSEATWKHVILEIAMRLDTGGYNQPSSASKIAKQDARIKELEKQLEVARKDARNLVELVLVAREWYWVPCSQASNYVNHELFPRNQNFAGTNDNKNPMWEAIDAAIRQIGGAE